MKEVKNANSREAQKVPKNQLTEYSTGQNVFVNEDLPPVPKPKSAMKIRAATEFFENQI